MCESIEFTLMGYCTVGCKICPQSVFQSAYEGTKEMSYNDFKTMLNKVPIDVAVIFSGFCEPFLNPNAVRMIELAFRSGHEVVLDTTLVGLSPGDVDRLAKYKFKEIWLHVPDNIGCARIPDSPLYAETLDRAVRSWRIDSFVQMNDRFVSNGRAGNCKDIIRPHIYGPLYCRRLFSHVIPLVLPSGDAYLCCMDFGLRHSIGNLLEDSYEDLIKGDSLYSLRQRAYGWNTDLLCRDCLWAMTPVQVFKKAVVKAGKGVMT